MVELVETTIFSAMVITYWTAPFFTQGIVRAAKPLLNTVVAPVETTVFSNAGVSRNPEKPGPKDAPTSLIFLQL